MILYIGNNLKSKNTNLTGAATLSILLRKEGFQVKVISSLKSQILRLLSMLLSIIWYAKKTNYVLIDTYSTRNFAYAFLTSQLCRVLGKKYIPILRGGDLPSRLEKSPRFCNMIFKNSYANIAPSNYLKEAFAKVGYAVKYIPNNLEINHYTFKERVTFSPKLLYVRSLGEIYNPQLAINVLSELKKEYSDASLCMVGPDKEGTLVKCKNLVQQLGLTDSVIFTGKLTKPQWHQLSNNYDVFINPTNFDNTPVSVMEAMALGLPVVSTNVGGIPYLIDDGVDGVLVSPNNTELMTLAVKEYIENPDKAIDMVKKARIKVEGFDWQVVKKLWVSILS